MFINMLDIKPIERVAILGKVGSRKPTLLKLLARQATATRGKVTLDGVDMAHMDPADMHRQVGFLSQDSRLFFGSIRQNLMLGNPQGITGSIAYQRGTQHGAARCLQS